MRTNFPLLLGSAAAFCLATGIFSPALAQDAAPFESFDKAYVNWYNRDATLNKTHGASVDRAYTELLQNRKPKKKVVVAVIDSGVDIAHEDLQGRIWVNEDEIAGNGLDDDNNGYVDDVHGWGLLGNANGENMSYEVYEYVRILRKLHPVYANIAAADVPADKQQEYETYLKSKQEFEKEMKEQLELQQNLARFEAFMQGAESVIAEHLQKETFTEEELKAISTKDKTVQSAKAWLLDRYKDGFTKESLQKAKEYNEDFLQHRLNLEFTPRDILGDNPDDITDTAYGNSDVTGPRAEHGTGVAGIIAGLRGNGLGIDGVASEVVIMPLRAVPMGDEYDKDIALAIRYAVDNGANIINMSFGKSFSPNKRFVDEAAKYAEAHNVLLVHSAGNDGTNIDTADNFPTKNLLDGSQVSTWIEVGASAKDADQNLSGSFSNYGQNKVDIFAPGVDVVTLAPQNGYAQVDGTSFASPLVSGVAALVWSHYPELTAQQLKEVLLASATKYPKLTVVQPSPGSGEKKKVKFTTLSKTGGVVNAYEALKLAEKQVKQQK